MEANHLFLRKDILYYLRSRVVLFFDYSEEYHFFNEVAIWREGRLCMYQTVSLPPIPKEDDVELNPWLASLFLAVAPGRCYPSYLSVVFSEGLSLVFVSVRPRLCFSHQVLHVAKKLLFASLEVGIEAALRLQEVRHRLTCQCRRDKLLVIALYTLLRDFLNCCTESIFLFSVRQHNIDTLNFTPIHRPHTEEGVVLTAFNSGICRLRST